MRITVEGYLHLKGVLGRRVYDLPTQPSPTLQDLMDLLKKEIPDQVPALDTFTNSGRQRHSLVILLNGRHVSHLPAGLDTRLEEGDLLSVFPPTIGG